ncbi:hypothetical protein IG631_02608 [Alternaria alternata]|nr:hypothetical protein IG631_02608 [Alternaria alternata]
MINAYLHPVIILCICLGNRRLQLLQLARGLVDYSIARQNGVNKRHLVSSALVSQCATTGCRSYPVVCGPRIKQVASGNGNGCHTVKIESRGLPAHLLWYGNGQRGLRLLEDERRVDRFMFHEAG